jgi:putative SOS response-associated peptidase YedK
MCGRVRLSSDVSEIKLAFSIPPHRPAPNFPPSWNVAPTDSLPVVRFDAKAGERSLDLLRWGLVPYWAKDLKVGFANINEVPKANRRFARRRSSAAAVLCRSITFTNWRRPKPAGSPYAIAPADGGLMALAGLWENWRSPDGEWMRTFAIITTTPNELCARLHNRMPVVLKREA